MIRNKKDLKYLRFGSFQFKDVIVVPFAYLLSSYSKFEQAENAVVQARTKKLSGKQNKRPSGFFESKIIWVIFKNTCIICGNVVVAVSVYVL